MIVRNSICIVEDDINSAFVLQTILSKSGYEVLPPVSTGEEAIARAASDNPALILMDITLSGKLDGIEAAKRIKQKYDIPIIYLTGYSPDTIIQRVKETTPFGFIIKPYDPKSVLITIEMALHKAAIEHESMETKRRLAITLGTLQNPVFSTDATGHITYLNAAAQNFLGVNLTHVMGQPFDHFLSFYTLDSKQKPMASFLEFKDKQEASEVVTLNKDRQQRYVRIQVNTLSDLYQNVEGYVIALNDFTEQFHYEQTNQKLASALTNSHEGVIIAEWNSHTNEFAIEYFNEGLVQLLGHPVQALKGQPVSKLFYKGFGEDVCSALAQRYPYATDIIMQRYDGKFIHTHWEITLPSDSNVSEYYTVITINDVTHLRQLEENLRQTQKIEAVGRLASGIAHDFNNLLSVINGYAELVLNKVSQEQDIYSHVKHIYEAGHKGASLVNQLMTFSRQNKQNEKTLIDVKRTAHNTLQMLQHWLGEKIQLGVRIDKNLWPIYSQETYIDQILVNLCVNAKDAMPQGGSLHIHFENFTGTPSNLSYGHYVKLTVSDTGIGIDPNIQKKIFEPFFTTKPIGQGTGLGLSCVYGIIKQHNGTIQIDSQLNLGTTFTIFMPANTRDSIRTTPQKITHPTTRPKRNIFLVQLPDTIAQCLYHCLQIQKETPHYCNQMPLTQEVTQEDRIVVPQSIANRLNYPQNQIVSIPDSSETYPHASVSHPYAVCEILKKLEP
ncbi:MAG: response regulator [Puniceicoccales bacterium]|jgi:PAS domain S-box-containing protein|nr:response regulator [Puniceicoccales bacterium]